MNGCCRDCGGCLDLDAYARCDVCAARARGEKPRYTLPDDEWQELTVQQQEEYRANGIHPVRYPSCS